MNLDDAVRTRRTNKVYERTPVPRETLDELFELARWAPNHHLTNPWRFRVVGPSSLDRLKQAVGEGAGKLDRAPTLVCVSQSMTDDPVQNDEDLCAVACAAYIVLLAAHARGIASYWRTPGVLRTAEGRAALGLGDDERAVALLHLGWSDREWMAPERAAVEDVVTYLARARELRAELASARTDAERHRGVERRSDPRFANHEVPWISLVRLGNEQALLLDVSSRGALLRTEIRPEHYLLKRADRSIRTGARLTLELAFERQIHAAGRVVRCVPSTTGPRTQYDVAFLFDESVGLHLPAPAALVHATSADGLRIEPLLTRDRARLDRARGDTAG